jgi:hypothetical protein
MPRRYEEILEDLENGDISNEEAATELKRFTSSSLRQEVAKLPELTRENEELRSKVDRMEKAPLKRAAFEGYGVDFARLTKAEQREIERYDGDLDPDQIGAFAAELEFPMTNGGPSGETEGEPQAAAVTRAARSAPNVTRVGRAGEMTPAMAAERAQNDPVWWETWSTEHPAEAERLEKGITVQM